MRPKYMDRGTWRFYQSFLVFFILVPIVAFASTPLIIAAIIYNTYDYMCCKIATYLKQHFNKLY